MGPTWGPSGTDRTQAGPMMAPWTLISWESMKNVHVNECDWSLEIMHIYRYINIVECLWFYMPLVIVRCFFPTPVNWKHHSTARYFGCVLVDCTNYFRFTSVSLDHWYDVASAGVASPDKLKKNVRLIWDQLYISMSSYQCKITS